MKEEQTLKNALEGDINAFQTSFAGFQKQLKSYLYRLLANRNDVEDLTHDTFIKAFEKLATFKGDSSLKTWVFQIATHLAYNYLQRQKRWTPDVSEQAKKLVLENEELRENIVRVYEKGTDAVYDIKEHIDTCFTCISKNLPIENQITLMLKDVYDFSVSEICQIMDKSEGTVIYLLHDGRKTMTDILTTDVPWLIKTGYVINARNSMAGSTQKKTNNKR
ncbi:MAG: RNA polymerase sigma factor [Cytophagales bacterium]|nr:RNA polymerase sigma factor [Cytophagales bacterium]